MKTTQKALLWSAFAALTVLFLATAAHAEGEAAASATGPIANRPYLCFYQSPDGSGVSTFEISGSATLKRGIEKYTFNRKSDNRKVTFAIKPENGNPPGGTRWEFTINPNGPQCKHTDVFGGGSVIVFDKCSDNHTRLCRLR